jgi:PAS domain S-box-containing protein
MKQAPIPPDEPQRLAALYALKILDTPPEERFDRITRLARHLFDVPIAAITFIDANREWRKSCQGPPQQIPRAISFCAHAILDQATLVIADALLDERFANNPLVVGEPKIRFYSGHPLTAPDGNRVGTLCLIDHQPRQLSEPELALLADMAAMVESELNLVEVVELQQQLSKANQELKNEMAERERAEQMLQSREAYFGSLIENVSDVITVLDEQGTILYESPSIERSLGYKENELLGKNAFEFIHPTDSANVMSILSSIVQRPYMISDPVQFRFQHKDGYWLFLESIGRVVPTGAGQMRVIVNSRDITERKRAEEERIRFTNQLRTAANVSAQINAILDPELLLGAVVAQLKTHFNLYHVHIYLLDEPTQALVMRAGSGEMGQLLRERGHKIALNHEQSIVARAVRSREIVLVNDVALEPNFLPNPLLPETRTEVAIPLIASGQVLGVLDMQDNRAHGFSQPDLDTFSTLSGQIAIALENARLFAERKQAEDALSLARDQALEASRLKSQLLANVSHDLRTPLNAIMGYTEMLQEGVYGPLSNQQHEATMEIISSAAQLLEFINNLLNQAQIEAGKMTLSPTSFTPTELVGHVQSVIGVLAHAKGLRLTSDIAPDMPLTLLGDIRWLRQVLLNLVSNALKFTERGSVHVHIYRPDETHWALQVTDTGCGISVEAQSYIFDPFRQVDGSVTREQLGVGLGLSIVKQLTNLMGGYITLTSEVGRGSTFTIVLPLILTAMEKT